MQNRLKRSGGDSVPAPEGLWNAVCVDYEYLENVKTQFGIKDKVVLRWQLQVFDDNAEELFREDGNRFEVRCWYTSSTHAKSNIAKALSTWRGKVMTEKELEDLDLETLVGKNCRLQIAHTITDRGGTFANIQGIVCPAAGVDLKPLNYTRKGEASDGNGQSEKSDLPF